MSLDEVLENKRLIVHLGNGGVGKTTVSAATALQLAQKNPDKRILVLTADPAKRLATAMGIDNISHTPSQVPHQENMYALMVNTKKNIDDMVSQYAPSKEHAQAILDNKFYDVFSRNFSGIEDFVSNGVVIETLKKDKDDPLYFDTIVVDTAPGEEGIHFLAAADHIDKLFSSRIIQGVFSQGDNVAKVMDNRISRKLFGLFSEYTNEEFIHEVAEFFRHFSVLKDPLLENAKGMHTYLRDTTQTCTALITAPDPTLFQETHYMAKTMEEKYRIPLSYMIVNKVEQGLTLSEEKRQEIQSVLSADAADQVIRRLEYDMHRAGNHSNAIAFSESRIRKPHYRIPNMHKSVHSIDSLRELGEKLFLE